MTTTTGNTSTWSPPTSTPDRDDGTEFINTIGTAVGPILTLFGEQATKQFLSMSMGWQDDILLACGPIGIITIVISAIRVGGYNWLKAVVGRARESRALAEQEFLSSTSEEVCELWSGHEVVRVTGQPNGMKDLIIEVERPVREEPSMSSRSVLKFSRVLDLQRAYWNRLLTPENGTNSYIDREVTAISSEAPNITLNVAGTFIHPLEKIMWVSIGVILQLAVLGLPALVTYHLKWLRKGLPVPYYAYWCYLTGSIATFTGTLLCGRSVEVSTEEFNFLSTDRFEASRRYSIQRILRIQLDGNVSSQRFPAFAILNRSHEKLIRSRMLSKDALVRKGHNLLTTTGALLAISGFLVQFVGLSALHFSATAVMLAVSVIMTSIRAFISRGLWAPPLCVEIPEVHRLAWLAHRAVTNDWENWVSDLQHKRNRKDSYWGIPFGYITQDMMFGSPTEFGCYGDPGFVARIGDFEIQCAEIQAMKSINSEVPGIPLGLHDDVTVRLANTLTRMMHTLKVSSNGYLTLCVRRSEGQLGAWVIQLPLDSNTKLHKSALQMGLVLSSYSLSKIPLELTSVIVQVLSSAGSLSEAERKVFELDSWMKGRAQVVPPYGESWRTVLNSQSQFVLGLHLSATFSSPQTHGVRSEESGSTGGDGDDTQNSLSQPDITSTGCKDIVMKFYDWTEDGIEKLLLLEVVSLFLFAACPTIEKPGPGRQLPNGQKSCQVFEDLANILIEENMAVDHNEAKVFIIPAFMHHNMLPECYAVGDPRLEFSSS